MDLVLIVGAGLFAGYVNAIAGAGSLLTLPVLIFSGLDASAANATNRIAVLTQAGTSGLAYRGRGVLPGRTGWWLTIPTSAAAAAGAYVATLLEPDAIQVAIAIVMVVMLVLQFVRPRAVAGRPADELGVTPGLVVGFAVMGLYAGFIQAGTGVLVLLFLSLVYRVDLVSANAIKVLVNLVLTVVAIAVFAGAGETIDLPRGLALAGATGLGGVVGARAAVRRGEGFVRLLLAAAVLASAAKLLYDAF